MCNQKIPVLGLHSIWLRWWVSAVNKLFCCLQEEFANKLHSSAPVLCFPSCSLTSNCILQTDPKLLRGWSNNHCSSKCLSLLPLEFHTLSKTVWLLGDTVWPYNWKKYFKYFSKLTLIVWFKVHLLEWKKNLLFLYKKTVELLP